MKVGHILREARMAAGLSQRQLAERAGTAQSAISRIEQDRLSPSVETLERIVECTGSRLRVYADPQARREPTHICNKCGWRITYGEHAHGCPPREA